LQVPKQDFCSQIGFIQPWGATMKERKGLLDLKNLRFPVRPFLANPDSLSNDHSCMKSRSWGNPREVCMVDAERLRIVAVDDQPEFLQVIEGYLASKYDVVCFSTGEDLLQHLDALEPDLVILDVNMPQMDGFSLCEQIRSRKQFEALPLLFLTASQLNEDFVKGMDVGANMFLSKPITYHDLNFTVEKMFSHFLQT
jgi:CheY-like chemotaxis protein